MNRIRKITIINPITDEKSVYQIRLLYDGEDMGNNNLCFCGSGIKKKKCHPDIHEKAFSPHCFIIIRNLKMKVKLYKILYAKKAVTNVVKVHFRFHNPNFYDTQFIENN